MFFSKIVANCYRAFSSHERCGIFETLFYHAATELDLINIESSFPVLLEALAETVMSIDSEAKGTCCS
jgi:hypothetical protein